MDSGYFGTGWQVGRASVQPKNLQDLTGTMNIILFNYLLVKMVKKLFGKGKLVSSHEQMSGGLNLTKGYDKQSSGQFFRRYFPSKLAF